MEALLEWMGMKEAENAPVGNRGCSMEETMREMESGHCYHVGDMLPELEDRVGLGEADLLPVFLCIHSLWLWVIVLILLIQNFLIMTSSNSKGQRVWKRAHCLPLDGSRAEEFNAVGASATEDCCISVGGRGDQKAHAGGRGRDFLKRELFLRGKGTI